MNTRRITTDLFNDPYFIGFDKMLNKLSTPAPGQTNVSNYPPYNLIKTGDDTYLIEIAVAGFDEKDFDIELHDGVLTIKAEIGETDAATNYLHKGIAARSFVRKFTLADTVEVDGVSLHQGMLTVKLLNIIPEEKKPKKILIGRPSQPELLTESTS
jgi:molecular chaperone IbpA